MPPSFRIAVVESDDLMRQLFARWLSDAGHRVEQASAKGLAGRTVDLVVADVPGLRAIAPLVRTVRAAHAGPLILVSARFGRGRGVPPLIGQQGVAALLAKPLTREELLHAVQAAMGAR